MKNTEERVHSALTHAVAALDLLHQWHTYPATRATDAVFAMGEVRATILELQSCWGVCEDCGDRLWRDLLTWNPDAGLPDLRRGGYIGKVQCLPCYRKWENEGEPGDDYYADLPEDHAARLAAADKLLRDAGRIS